MTGHNSRIDHMIDGQLTPHSVTDARVIQAFQSVDREDFVPDAYKGVAYIDDAIPLSEERSMIPSLVAGTMLELADIEPSDKVMHVGSGTGYLCAVTSKLAKSVFGVEDNQELASRSRTLLRELSADTVEVISAPLISGYADQAPYNVILIEGAIHSISEELFEQLADGGRMLFVRQADSRGPGHHGMGHLMCCRRVKDRFEVEECGEFALPVLPGFDEEIGFEF